MPGDFYYLSLEGARSWAWVGYLLIIGTYLTKQLALLRNSIAEKSIQQLVCNLPRNLVIAGTFLSWYVGIVHFNSDLAFTAINVMSHGIPYMALVWTWGIKRYTSTASAGVGLNLPLQKRIFRPALCRIIRGPVACDRLHRRGILERLGVA
jgi:hypothetical protein